jgi:hypothetical protein
MSIASSRLGHASRAHRGQDICQGIALLSNDEDDDGEVAALSPISIPSNERIAGALESLHKLTPL